MAPPVLHDLACAVHVHSTCSDGTATVSEIAAAAARAGLDAVLLTDHDTLEARRLGHEGWHGDVFVLVGEEVSPRGGHLLAFGTETEIGHRGESEAEVAGAVRRAGGLGFAAHPFSTGPRMGSRYGRPHPWPDLEGSELTGIEVWSLLTEEAEAWRNPLEALRFMLAPARRLAGPPAENLAGWDRLCARRRVVGLGGLDAHQSGRRRGRRVLTPMPNARYLGLLTTHLLLDGAPTGEVVADRDALFDALREGRCYIGVEAFGPARGFAYWAERGDETLPMGAEAPGGGWTLHARAPAEAELRLLRDGREVARTVGRALDHATEESGAHRVEAHLLVRGQRRRWILSNPVYLRGPGSSGA